MKKVAILTTLALCLATVALARDYNFISAVDLKEKLDKQEELLLLDIQVENEYNQHHIEGTVATYAYPVKTETDRAKLDSFAHLAGGNGSPVVIVCPRGGGGAKRAYDYLAEEGISENRLVILEGGQSKWPF